MVRTASAIATTLAVALVALAVMVITESITSAQPPPCPPGSQQGTCSATPISYCDGPAYDDNCPSCDSDPYGFGTCNDGYHIYTGNAIYKIEPATNPYVTTTVYEQYIVCEYFSPCIVGDSVPNSNCLGAGLPCPKGGYAGFECFPCALGEQGVNDSDTTCANCTSNGG